MAKHNPTSPFKTKAKKTGTKKTRKGKGGSKPHSNAWRAYVSNAPLPA
jgi:hypothetical protein